MFPELRLDLSNFSTSKVVLLATPIMPGFAAVAGVAMVRPEFIRAYFMLGYLGYFAKVTMLVLLGYVVGMSLMMTAFTLVFLAVVLIGIFRRSPSPNSPDLICIKITEAYLSKANILVPVAGSREEIAQQWQTWWKVLDKAFREDDEDETIAMGIIAMIHSTATVALILLFYSPLHHWIFWLFTIAVFLAASFSHFAIMSVFLDDDTQKLSARILRRLVDLNTPAQPAETKQKGAGAGVS